MTLDDYRSIAPKPKNKRGHPEADEQATLFWWAVTQLSRHPELELLHHIPNGGSRHPAEAASLKRQGVRAGVPDISLPVARRGYHGLYIELKADKGRVSDKQKGWLDALTAQGYRAVVCYGWREAAEQIETYLTGGGL